jgi:DNA integrity scanning protein DisA with diadenylate cyclase activity
MAQSLSKVDGAIHMGADLHLHGFACILDGLSISGENLARGARFNSALRFTARHENVVVVVVSSDRPVSVIQGGVELNAQCQFKPLATSAPAPVLMKSWLSWGAH